MSRSKQPAPHPGEKPEASASQQQGQEPQFPEPYSLSSPGGDGALDAALESFANAPRERRPKWTANSEGRARAEYYAESDVGAAYVPRQESPVIILPTSPGTQLPEATNPVPEVQVSRGLASHSPRNAPTLVTPRRRSPALAIAVGAGVFALLLFAGVCLAVALSGKGTAASASSPALTAPPQISEPTAAATVAENAVPSAETAASTPSATPTDVSSAPKTLTQDAPGLPKKAQPPPAKSAPTAATAAAPSGTGKPLRTSGMLWDSPP